MSYDDNFIKINSSIPNLQDKIHVDIISPNNKIYWYIKFNLSLDPESVNNETTNVTDTEGYILETEISYLKKKKLIAINPLEDYIQNQYYLLNITKDVRSENLNNLKNDIHILFKIKGTTVAEFKILPKNVIVPQPRRRPIARQVATNSRVYQFQKDNKEPMSEDARLRPVGLKLNPILAILGLALTLGSIFLFPNIIAISLSGLTAFAGIVHIAIQVLKRDFRSNLFYNKGARLYNKDKFEKAERSFNKALKINPDNEYGEYALNKLSYVKKIQ